MKYSPHYHHLKNKWLEKHKILQEKLLIAHKDIAHLLNPKQHLIGTFMLASTPFMSIAPATASAIPPITYEAPYNQIPHLSKSQLAEILKKKLPADVRPLTEKEENDIATALSESFNMKVSPELQGIRLNKSYGLIGKEQHLARYPGDSIYEHIDETSETHISDGMAPGLGAWGYFTRSKSTMNNQDILREKYYIAVPTFLAPGWEK